METDRPGFSRCLLPLAFTGAAGAGIRGALKLGAVEAAVLLGRVFVVPHGRLGRLNVGLAGTGDLSHLIKLECKLSLALGVGTKVLVLGTPSSLGFHRGLLVSWQRKEGKIKQGKNREEE